MLMRAAEHADITSFKEQVLHQSGKEGRLYCVLSSRTESHDGQGTFMTRDFIAHHVPRFMLRGVASHSMDAASQDRDSSSSLQYLCADTPCWC